MEVEAGAVYGAIRTALAEERCVVLDGAIATELPHQVGQDHERLWGIEALASSPDDVLDVHRRYVQAGADVITTNTWALPAVIAGESGSQGDGDPPLHWMEIARRGIRIARNAISNEDSSERCSVAFSLNGDLVGEGGVETVSLIERAIAADPPDLILVETLSVLRPVLFDVVEALLATGIPLWLSFRRCTHGLCGVYGQHWGGPEGDAFGRAARRFEEIGVDALLVNCIPPDHVDGITSYLRDFTDLPLGVYPNLGYYSSAGWRFESEIGGAEYAQMAQRWRAEGAQIIGGCCGTKPVHIASAKEAVAGTRPGRERRRPLRKAAGEPVIDTAALAATEWRDRRSRPLFPLPFPKLAAQTGVPSGALGSYTLWRHLLQEGIGAHRRCLDVCSGSGLQTVQLALNGAAHVHAIDIDERAVANTLETAFSNDVADQVSAEAADLYPWVPQERYEVIVANVPQTPVDPLSDLSSHRPTDYWGRGLVDQLLLKLPDALASEGQAFVTVHSLLSPRRTAELIEAGSLAARVVSWELHPMPNDFARQREHLAQVEKLSDGYTVHAGRDDCVVVYVLEIQHARSPAGARPAPWEAASP